MPHPFIFIDSVTLIILGDGTNYEAHYALLSILLLLPLA
jgi:hypothetical protein